jgi:ribosomal-protein-alanine N-acetyltransferase
MVDSPKKTPPTIPGSSLRPATPDDLPALLAVEARVHTAPWTQENFEGEWEKGYSNTWVLTDDDTDREILGYVVYWLMEETIEILNIAVDFPYRGLGFAQKILQQVIREGLRQNAKRLILDVRKSNLPAVALYQKTGMAITQVRKGFYSNGEDAYHFALELEGQRLDI